MNDWKPTGGELVNLPVRTRTTEYGDGENTDAVSVLCPVSDKSVSLTRCLDCARLVEFIARNETNESFICCQVPEAAASEARQTPVRRANFEGATVSQVMSAQVTCVDAGLGLDELARIFARDHLHAVPVVDEDGVLVGIVSQSDLTRGRRANDDDESESGEVRVPPSYLGLTVGDLMSAPVFKLSERTSLANAVAFMAREQLHQVPIVNDEDEVVGILSSIDVVRWVAGLDSVQRGLSSDR